jgi:putative PIG3 family NAD(P)H quinone oxidoreductase
MDPDGQEAGEGLAGMTMTVPNVMTGIKITKAGPPEVLKPADWPVPTPGQGEVLIRIEAAGLNRGDTMQRQGAYPPPPGASEIPGLEAAGAIAAVGPGISGWSVGDRVCALLAGGGYAEFVAVPEAQCLPLPNSVTSIEGAALPETLFTCWANIAEDGRLAAGETLLIHGGASGIGTTGIQLAKSMGAKVFVTAGSAEKCAACVKLGADLAINYRDEDFVQSVLAATGGRGVDLVLDMVGADYAERSLQAMAPRGRYVMIGLMKSAEATISLRHLLTKRVTMTGSTLRGRSIEEKGRLRDAIRGGVWPKISSREIVGVVHRTFPLEDAAEAHRALEASDHIGKLILTTQYLSAT